jgi:hypothetical protein
VLIKAKLARQSLQLFFRPQISVDNITEKHGGFYGVQMSVGSATKSRSRDEQTPA